MTTARWVFEHLLGRGADEINGEVFYLPALSEVRLENASPNRRGLHSGETYNPIFKRAHRAPSGKFPTAKRSGLARQVGRRWIESEEFNDAAPMGFRRAVLVFLPFLDSGIRNS